MTQPLPITGKLRIPGMEPIHLEQVGYDVKILLMGETEHMVGRHRQTDLAEEVVHRVPLLPEYRVGQTDWRRDLSIDHMTRMAHSQEDRFPTLRLLIRVVPIRF